MDQRADDPFTVDIFIHFWQDDTQPDSDTVTTEAKKKPLESPRG